ncbi:MAG: hypothetical protein ACFFBI_00350 [Promethearchaeota archaeon]
MRDIKWRNHEDMELNTLQKWNIVNRVESVFNCEALFQSIKKISKLPAIQFNTTKIDFHSTSFFKPIPKNYKIAIIDFEGNPVFLCGIYIQDVILNYYIKNYKYLDHLYLTILEVIRRAKDLVFFCFSKYENKALMRIYSHLQFRGYDTEHYDFIESFPVINLQKDKFESLTEAIYSIHFKSSITSGDPLFRNSKLVEQLFHAHKFEDIIAHNQNCLLNEGNIFLKRWLINHRI